MFSFLWTASKEGGTNREGNQDRALSSRLVSNCLLSVLAKTGAQVFDVVITTVETTKQTGLGSP